MLRGPAPVPSDQPTQAEEQVTVIAGWEGLVDWVLATQPRDIPVLRGLRAGEPIAVLDARLDLVNSYSDGSPHQGRIEVGLLLRRRHAPEPVGGQEYIAAIDPLSQLTEISAGVLWRRWFELYRTDGPAIRLLLAASHRLAGMDLRAHVVGIVVAAEWWHKNRFTGKRDAPEVHRNRIAQVLAAATTGGLADAELEWLQRRLGNANDKSLLDRLLDSCRSGLVRDLTGDPAALNEGSVGRAGKWAAWVRDARTTGQAHAGSSDSEGTFWAAESLRWVLLGSLMQELGLGNVAHRLDQQSGYQFCRQQVRAATGGGSSG